MKKFGSLILSGLFVLLVAGLWLYPKINSAKHDTYVRVIEKPSALSHWESVKKNVEAVQLEKQTQKELVNPERFETKEVSVENFEFDEDMYGRGMHYEPLIEEPIITEADSTAPEVVEAGNTALVDTTVVVSNKK